MGSQLSAMAPTSIHPVEYYLSDLASSESVFFDLSLGSTRFFKVARVRLKSGQPLNHGRHASQQIAPLAVAKVFVIHDISLPVKKYKDRLERLKEKLLDGASNTLPFTRIIVNDKFGILLRQFVKYSLYDRLSTRPFLSMVEKKWIAFQLLKAFQWIHRNGLTHGDLKLENILITSCLWVLVTDFAVYKPTFVPDDNPSDFNFFFDTSGRRKCNLAPERFRTQEDFIGIDSIGPSSPSHHGQQVTPQMDLFSLGCVLAELFAESSDFELFDLSSILQYKSDPKRFLDEKLTDKLSAAIPDESIRGMIVNLIDMDPSMRNSTTQHLVELTPVIFPNSFSLLYSYFKELTHLSPDGKIVRLHDDIRSLISPVIQDDPNGLLIILNLLTSNLRSLKHVNAKTSCIRLIRQVVDANVAVMSPYILDRVLPYLLSVVCDPLSPSVRRVAIDVLTHVLSLVQEVSSSDNNVFIDYILPVLARVAADRSSFVRAGLAANLGSLAETASRFQQLSSATSMKDWEEEMVKMFQDMISHLLTDPSNEVKRTLLDSDVSKLCVFLGRAKTNDVILSHIITFLNDKDDFELRAGFFDNIVPIASYLGSQSSSILRPLLQQGLSDADEFVIQRTLTSLTSLTELKFLDRTLLIDLMSESVPLLAHPNLWIRNQVVSFLMTLSDQLSMAETHCKVIPLVRKKLTKDIHVLSADLVMEYLQPPITRDLYSMVINKNNPPATVEGLFDYLKQQKHLKTLQGRHHVSPGQSTVSGPFVTLHQKLVDNGMTDSVADQLIDLSDIMIRICRNSSRPSPAGPAANLVKKTHRRIGSSSSVKSDLRSSDPSVIFLESSKTNRIKVHAFSLVEEDKLVTAKIRQNIKTMNDDWKHMFGSQYMDPTPVGEDAPILESYSDPAVVVPIASEAQEDPEPCPPCRRDVRHLEVHKRDSYEMSLWSRGIDLTSQSGEMEVRSLTAGERVHPAISRPRGMLVSHLHEHLQSVNRLVSLSGSNLFASASSDGFIKVWDAGKISHMDKDPSSPPPPISKSSQSMTSNDMSAFEGVTYCSSLDYLIGVTSKSVLHVVKVDSASTDLRLLGTHDLHQVDWGRDVDVTDIISCSPFSVTTSFSSSSVTNFDLRMPFSRPAYAMTIDMRDGFVTCLTGTEYAVFAAASSGAIYTFDTRFLIRANTVSYGVSRRIRRLLHTPTGLLASVARNNEVTLFDCETGFRQKTLWASRAPILTQEPDKSTAHSVCGMIYLHNPKDKMSSTLITAGTDMRIRVWDLNAAEKSYVMSDGYTSSRLAGTTRSDHQTFSYSSKIVDAIQVLVEEEKRPVQASGAGGQGSNYATSYVDPNFVNPAHHNTISDLIFLEGLGLLVSSSKDGVIKIWK